MATNTSSVRDKYVVYTILILAFYCLGQLGSRYFYPLYSHYFAAWPSGWRSAAWSGTYYGLVPVIGTILIFGREGFWRRMGLDKGFWQGLRIAFIMALPMLLGYAWVAKFQLNVDLGRDFIYGSVAAPFFEELFFRAFLFGLLYRFAGWKLWPATLLDGIVFGAIHLSQGSSFGEVAGVFAVTAGGAIGFSILFKEWDWNLWLVIFLHAFMNFYWMAFDIADNAAGGLWANVFRLATVAIAIGMTYQRVKRRREGARPPRSATLVGMRARR